MKCRICSGDTSVLFRRTLLQKYEVDYLRCQDCGYVCTEQPYWLEEAYARPINISDTGVIARNEKIRDALAWLFWRRYPKGSQFLDYAGGYGVLTRMMRDCGYDFFWYDPYTQNLFAQGFELPERDFSIQAMTCLECFEHFVDPFTEITKQLELCSNIYFTTTLISGQAPEPEEWDYYGFSHGQHVSFYTQKSLRILAERLGLQFRTNGGQFHFIGKEAPSDFSLRIAYSPWVRFLQLPLRELCGSLTQSDWQKLKE